PLDCPPNERCKPESMVGTMNPLDGNPRPFQGGEQVSGDIRILYSVDSKNCVVFIWEIGSHKKVYGR
ncbi:MAG: hypothetical protein QXY87_14260, partial [Saccharolobus sp.]|uniref:type II toxin-antitoxin system RelE family toxin n=1 Tax=Saccharolobus sp. TaxID=2100761 RepID=UPI003176FEB2